jgi:hypothetical protein
VEVATSACKVLCPESQLALSNSRLPRFLIGFLVIREILIISRVVSGGLREEIQSTMSALVIFKHRRSISDPRLWNA